MSSVKGRFTCLELIKRYVHETDTQCLDLHHLDMQLPEVKSVLQCLSESGVIELNLSNKNFRNQLSSLAELLSKTNVNKLNLSSCILSEEDALSLFKILKDSKMTDLNVSRNRFLLSDHDATNFSSYLRHSHLTALNLSGSPYFFYGEDIDYFINAVFNSSITHLNVDALDFAGQFSDEMIQLFLKLKESSITHLSAASNPLYRCDLTQIGDSLRESKLVELNLSYCRFNDKQVDILFETLVGTQITALNLAGCRFYGLNNIFRYLKQTQIERLDLSDNVVTFDDRMFDFPDFLSGTSVLSLNLHRMDLPDDSGVKIMRNLKSSKLEELSIGGNQFTHHTLFEFSRIVTQTAIVKVNFGRFYSFNHDQLIVPSISLIGDLLVQSGIKHVDLTNFQVRKHIPDTTQKSFWGKQPLIFATFLDCVKDSCVTSLILRICQLDEETAKIAFPNFVNSKVTHLDLGSNMIGGGLQSFAAILKSTVITHLNLKKNFIKDNDVKVLAECLKETCIIALNLSRNGITNWGAKFLAFSLRGTDILTLKLKENEIKDQGMKDLAENAAKSLITTLKVSKNPGNMRLVETVIWNNRRIVLQFVRFFKRIAPENGSNAFKFEDNVSTVDCGTFLEECLNFYDMSRKHSSASLILSQEESFSRPREQIMALLSEEFPRQFVNFVVTKIEASTQERITFLKKVEEMGLTQIVKLLLSNRPIYSINESLDILHPYVYQLLNKYELPIHNLEGELQEIRRIVEYFTEFSNTEGAADVISMLKNKYTF